MALSASDSPVGVGIAAPEGRARSRWNHIAPLGGAAHRASFPKMRKWGVVVVAAAERGASKKSRREGARVGRTAREKVIYHIRKLR
jgi:hypothetical protein